MVNKIVVSGPVIIDKGRLLVVREGKDAFYKLPGGTSKDGESLEKTCMREAREEINADILITKEILPPFVLHENPTTHEKMQLEVHSYSAVLLNPKDIRAKYSVKELKWLDIDEIKNGRYNVAPSIEFLIERGKIK